MKFSPSAVSLFLWTSIQQTPPSIAFVVSTSTSSRCTSRTQIPRKASALASIGSYGGVEGSSRTVTTTSATKCRNNPSWSLERTRKLSTSHCISNPKTLSSSRFVVESLSSVRGGSSSSALYSSTAHISEATEKEAAEVAAAMTKPVENFRTDYLPLPFTVSTVDMNFDLHEGKTIVTTSLTLVSNPLALAAENKELVLDGEQDSITLLSISMDGKELVEGLDYDLFPEKLVLKNPKDGAVITSKVQIVPETNTKLSGLYKSSGMYCTQCEAMGFRRITYYPDRPDNMAVFRSVRIEADKKQYPLLLSNGNLIEEGNADDGERHYAVWSDPFPKPSYLFATVAGNLGKIEDTFTTKSGRAVKLALYSEPKNVGKLQYAMDSLKRSMKWDEDRFNLEYDLDIFNVVAVEDFNMGAMENKSLNVFNTALILADEKTATDSDYERIEGVIGHEYFHNWTGNRVTCRDWFQLTLKEGLTVFRDQEFSADMNSPSVKRIEDVRMLRARQFGEDAGPMSHPIRPESYIAMDNFYTATVYEKGAEVIRMYQTILGVDGFNKGMALYFERHDGQAVTCEDFLQSMADANNADLSTFKKWYSTKGTPIVKYDLKYESGIATLTLSQSNTSAEPLHIPVAVGLLDKATGDEVVPTTVLDLKEMTQTFKFDGLKGAVVPSILRGFSAPVKLVRDETMDIDEEEMLAFLAARDTDGFNRWEAGQKLYTALIFKTMDGKETFKTLDYVYEAFGRTLAADTSTMDYSIKAYALLLPAEMTLAEELDIVDPIAIHKARGTVKKLIARKFKTELLQQYNAMTTEMEGEASSEFQVNALAIGKRRLRNVFLEYLCSMKDTDEEVVEAAEMAMKHYQTAKCLTDKMAAFNVLASMHGAGASYRDAVVELFYKEADGDMLVLNKWFTVQAMADLPDILERIKQLKESPDFTLKNPNRVRSLIGAFASNPVAFHDESGAGYDFMLDTLKELDPINPVIASRLAAGSIIKWKRYNESRAIQMKNALEKFVSESTSLSKDLFEIVSKGLQ